MTTMHAQDIERLIQNLTHTETGPHTELLAQARKALEHQKKTLIHWEAQSFEIRSHLGQVLGPVLDLIALHPEAFHGICQTEYGLTGEDAMEHLLQLKAFQMGIPVEHLEDPTKAQHTNTQAKHPEAPKDAEVKIQQEGAG
ncbi:hypothetical protein [Deinococcus cellulosilyticus]|nr:hypothetical protein [Deinococcus cellulosilyticus]